MPYNMMRSRNLKAFGELYLWKPTSYDDDRNTIKKYNVKLLSVKDENVKVLNGAHTMTLSRPRWVYDFSALQQSGDFVFMSVVYPYCVQQYNNWNLARAKIKMNKVCILCLYRIENKKMLHGVYRIYQLVLNICIPKEGTNTTNKRCHEYLIMQFETILSVVEVGSSIWSGSYKFVPPWVLCFIATKVLWG